MIISSATGISGFSWPSEFPARATGTKEQVEAVDREQRQDPLREATPETMPDTARQVVITDFELHDPENKEEYENRISTKSADQGAKAYQAAALSQPEMLNRNQMVPGTQDKAPAVDEKPWQAEQAPQVQADDSEALAPASSPVPDQQLAAQATVLEAGAKFDQVTNERLGDAAGAANNAEASAKSASPVRPVEPSEKGQGQNLSGNRQRALNAYTSQSKPLPGYIASA